MPDADGTQRIEAAVIFKADAGVGTADLSQQVAQSADLVRGSRQDRLVGSLPRTTSGKIDRRQLRKQAGKRSRSPIPDVDGPATEPRSTSVQ
jgi:acyl-coenzyme A synthetase/AMP-(fatty) acid ligase